MRNLLFLKLAWLTVSVVVGQALGAITARLVPESVLTVVKQLLLLASIGVGAWLVIIVLLRLARVVLFRLEGKFLSFADPEQVRWDRLGSWSFLFCEGMIISYLAALPG